MTQTRLMTADEAVAYCVNRYPTLYASLNENSTRMRVLDQLFNVIGNGYRDHNEFVQNFTWTPQVATMAAGIPQKYAGPDPIYEGFTKVRPTAMHSGRNVQPDFNSRIRGLYTRAEQEHMPHVLVWHEHEKGEGIGFYPNFSAQYSLLYRVDRAALDESWLQAGIDFYTEARRYFASQNVQYYSGAWPNEPAEQEKCVKEFERDMPQTSDADKKAWLAEMSENYGVPYHGSTATFLQTHWIQEKARIQAFIDSTISMLEGELAHRAAMGPTP